MALLSPGVLMPSSAWRHLSPQCHLAAMKQRDSWKTTVTSPMALNCLFLQFISSQSVDATLFQVTAVAAEQRQSSISNHARASEDGEGRWRSVRPASSPRAHPVFPALPPPSLLQRKKNSPENKKKERLQTQPKQLLNKKIIYTFLASPTYQQRTYLITT